MTDSDSLKKFGKWLLGGHDIRNIERDGGRVVTTQEIDSFLQGEWPQYQPMKSPPISNNGNAHLKSVFGELDKLRGYRPPKRKAEAAAIIRMLKQFTPEQIVNTYKTLKEQPFWKDKELFMMSVESQIGAIQSVPKGKDKYEYQKYNHLFQR